MTYRWPDVTRRPMALPVGILPPDVACYGPAPEPANGDVVLRLRSVDRGSDTISIPLAVFGTVQEALEFFAEEFGSLPHSFAEVRPVR